MELPRASNSKLTRENNRYIFNAYYNASTSTSGVRVLRESDVSKSVSVVDLNLAGWESDEMADFIDTKKTIRNKIPVILYPRAELNFF